MLLIAVTGSVGAGKSTVLREVADSLGTAFGFIQIAGVRDEPQRGASTYELLLLPQGETIPFLSRTEDGYAFDEKTLKRAHEQLTAAGDVAVIDEFGVWELDGGGHLPAWPTLVHRAPRACLVGVRGGRVADAESALGRPFDIVVEAGDQDAAKQILAALSELRDWERVGVYGAGAGGMEATLGAALHTFKFPLTGLVMASLQVVVMSMAAESLQRRERVVWVSTISAGLKALSPSGSRLGPMLAITVQGILATTVFRLFGWNRLGAFLAGAVACAWAGLQGLLIQYLLLGNGLVRAYDAAAKWIGGHFNFSPPGMIVLVVGLAALYALVGGSFVLWAWGKRSRWETRWQERIPSPQAPVRDQSIWKQAAYLLRPAFLVPVLIVSLILFAAGTAASDIGWMVLRALAVGLALVGVIRWVDPAGFLRFLRRRGKWGPAYAISKFFK